MNEPVHRDAMRREIPFVWNLVATDPLLYAPKAKSD